MLSTVVNKFINDRGSVAGEIVGENVYSYVRGNGLASYFDGTNVGIYTSNLHGDVSQIIAYGQKSLAKYGFDAFGNENSAANTVHNPFGYCGEYQDLSSGLVYLRNRYYDPSIGRFISEDPVKDGMNWYVYCANNPIRYKDPSGLVITCDEANSGRIISLLREVSGNSLEFEYKDGQINITKTYDTKHHVGADFGF